MSTDRLALLIDDDRVFADSTANYFKSIGWETIIVSSLKEADESLERSSPALLVVDVDLGDGNDGIEWLRSRKERGLTAKVIVVSASRQLRDINRAMGIADSYLLKPLFFVELCRRLVSLGMMLSVASDASRVGVLEVPARVKITDSVLIVQCTIRWTEGQAPQQITINQGKTMGFELKKMRGLGSSSQPDGLSLSIFQPNGWSGGARNANELAKDDESPFSVSAMIFQGVRNITTDGISVHFNSSIPLPPGERFTLKWKDQTIIAQIEVLEQVEGSEPDYKVSASIQRTT